MRFLHTADWQLGMGRHYLDRERQGQFDAARRDVLGALGRVAVAEGCEAIVVCGDVFETNHVSARTVRQAMEKLRDIPVPVYLLPGNHDPLNAGSVWDSPRFLDAKPGQVHVIRDATPVEVRPGFEIVGAPWPSKRPTTDLLGDALAALEPCPPGVVRVAVGHGAVDTYSKQQAASLALIRHESVTAALEQNKVHYVALGDRHSVTEVAPRLWYSGAPEPTAFVEVDPGQVLVVELDPDDPARPPAVTAHHVATWTFVEIEVDLDGAGDVAELRERITALRSKDKTVLKVVAHGTLSVADREAFDAVLADAAEDFAAVVPSSRTDLMVRPEDADFDTLGLSGFAALTLADLREQAVGPDPEQAATAADALTLLVRLVGGRA